MTGYINSLAVIKSVDLCMCIKLSVFLLVVGHAGWLVVVAAAGAV